VGKATEARHFVRGQDDGFRKGSTRPTICLHWQRTLGSDK
jgi:hypothetical protein